MPILLLLQDQTLLVNAGIQPVLEVCDQTAAEPESPAVLLSSSSTSDSDATSSRCIASESSPPPEETAVSAPERTAVRDPTSCSSFEDR